MAVYLCQVLWSNLQQSNCYNPKADYFPLRVRPNLPTIFYSLKNDILFIHLQLHLVLWNVLETSQVLLLLVLYTIIKSHTLTSLSLFLSLEVLIRQTNKKTWSRYTYTGKRKLLCPEDFPMEENFCYEVLTLLP